MSELNINHEKNRKNLLKFLFYADLIVLIVSFFRPVNFKIAFIVNFIVLLLQVIMDSVQPYVKPIVSTPDSWAHNVNNYAGRING